MKYIALTLAASLFLIHGPTVAHGGPIELIKRTVALAELSTQTSDVPIQISIESKHEDTGMLSDTLAVMLKTGKIEIGGFSLKIGLDDPDLVITEVLPGDLIDSCKWEFFKARSRPEAGVGGNPMQLWSAVAMAELVTDSSGEKCFSWPSEISLLKLVVASSPGELIRDKEIPIFFWWESCADNTLSDRNGGKLYMSSEVVGSFGPADTSTADRFPTGGGAIKICSTRSKLNPPERLIKFRNGAVKFELGLGQPVDSSQN